ncbi:MAG: cache domain-containing protein, partial [Gammaproteobacteria bacterium]
MFPFSRIRQRYLSLLWKAILAISIATCLASGTIVLVGKWTLENKYDQERARIQRSYRQAFNGILSGIKSDKVELSWLIPTLLDPSISNAKALDSIRQLLDRSWFQVELVSDMESAFLFTREGRLVGHWGNNEFSSQFAEQLDYVASHESPFDSIVCIDSCIHFHASPFLHNGDFIGIFIFGISLADTVLQMKHITGSNIGILTHTSKPSKKNLLQIKPWLVNIVALTEIEKNSVLLQEFSERYPVNLPKEATIFESKGKTYEFISLPFNDNNDTILLIIEDITESYRALTNATAVYALGGLLSLLFSGGVLAILLINPSR